MEDLVNDNLFNSDKKLELLNEKDMAEGTCLCAVVFLLFYKWESHQKTFDSQ